MRVEITVSRICYVQFLDPREFECVMGSTVLLPLDGRVKPDAPSFGRLFGHSINNSCLLASCL